MSMKTKFLSDILLIEGIQVPVAEATYAGTVGADAQMTFRIPYTERAEYIRPRALIHFFWVDSDFDGPMFGFTGDLVAVGVVKSGSGVPSIVITAVGHSNYWSSVSLFNVTGLGKAGKEIANFVGAQTVTDGGGGSIFGSGSSHAFYNKLIRTFSSPSKSFPRVKGVLGGVMHLLEYVGGWFHGRRVFRGINDFTSLAELRLKLMQQILASKTDSSSVMLLKKKGLKDWAKNVIGRRGTMVSFDQLLQQFFQFIFYVKAPIFAGPYWGPEHKVKVKSYQTRHYDISEKEVKKVLALQKYIEKIIDALEDSIGTVRFKEAPVSEAWYVKEQMKGVSRAAEVNRSAHLEGHPIRRGIGKLNHIRSMFDHAEVLLEAVSPQYRPRCLHTAYRLFDKWKLQVELMPYDRSIRQAWSSGARSVQTVLMRCLHQMSGITHYTVSHHKKRTEWTEPDRLGTVGIWPELLFSPPPRFNVIFPTFIASFQYNRNILQEPTRLMLRGAKSRKGDIFSGGYSKLKVYFAPDTPNMRGAVKMGSSEFAKSVMPHEIFTGIVPAQKQVPWAGAYRIKARGKVEYAQRLANYEYLKARYQNRSGSVQCIFRPQIMVGLPILIIPSYVEDVVSLGNFWSSEDKDALAEKVVPDAYLGYCQAVQHTLSAAGSSTRVTVTYLRTHREDLGEQYKKVKVKVGSKKKVVSKTKIVQVVIEDGIKGDRAALVKKYFGWDIEKVSRHRIAQQAEVWTYYIQRRFGRIKAAYGTWHGTVTWEASYVAEVAHHGLFGSMPKIKAVPATVYKVHVKDGTKLSHVPVYDTRRKKLSFEEMATPPWLDKKWHPENIDKTYRELFGVGSVLDPVEIAYPPGFTAYMKIDEEDEE